MHKRQLPNFHEYAILHLVIRMNNIPMFLSQGGTASLVLREIPYSGKAYVLLQTVIPDRLPMMIEECCGFCKTCGAQQIFFSWKDGSLPLPKDHDILNLTVQKSALPLGTPVSLQPICEANDSIYISIYNKCFSNVSNAAFYDRKQIQRIYLLHQQAYIALTEAGTPFGIGELHENELAAIGVLPEYRGQGFDLALSLMERCPGPEITLTVASDNTAALRLYEKLGFHVSGIASSWYLAGS